MQLGVTLARGVTIQVSLRDTSFVQVRHTPAGLLAQFIDRAELD